MSKPHSFDWHISKHRQIAVACSRCGLVLLKNEASQKAAKKPCPGREIE